MFYAVCKLGEAMKAKGTKFFSNRASAEKYLHTFDRPRQYAAKTIHSQNGEEPDYDYGYFCLSQDSIWWEEHNVQVENKHAGYEKLSLKWETRIYNEYHVVEIEVEE